MEEGLCSRWVADGKIERLNPGFNILRVLPVPHEPGRQKTPSLPIVSAAVCVTKQKTASNSRYCSGFYTRARQWLHVCCRCLWMFWLGREVTFHLHIVSFQKNKPFCCDESALLTRRSAHGCCCGGQSFDFYIGIPNSDCKSHNKSREQKKREKIRGKKAQIKR